MKPRGKELLDKMMTEQFVPIDDTAYDSIRTMKQWVDKKAK